MAAYLYGYFLFRDPPVSSLFPSAGRSKPKLKDVAELLKSGRVHNVCVLAGAGISVAAGMPDFSSPGTELYGVLSKYNLPYPQAAFSLDYFLRHPEPFYALAKEFYPDQYCPTIAHCFIKLLEEKNMLRRCWTQNIDCLERRTGLTEDKIVEAHGSFATAICVRCGAKYKAEDIKGDVLQGKVPRCQQGTCEGTQGGLIKPNIVFLGEELSATFFDKSYDFEACSLLICAGTSLEIAPFNQLITRTTKYCPRLLINRKMVGTGRTFGSRAFKKKRDAIYLGDCDEGFQELARLCGWEDELDAIVQRVRLEHKIAVEGRKSTVGEGQSKHSGNAIADLLAETQLGH